MGLLEEPRRALAQLQYESGVDSPLAVDLRLSGGFKGLDTRAQGLMAFSQLQYEAGIDSNRC